MSLDAEIAALARAVRESPEDAMARYRWRCALVRAGRGSEAGLEVGDVIENRAGTRATVVDESGGRMGAALERNGARRCLCRLCRPDWQLLEPARPQAVPA